MSLAGLPLLPDWLYFPKNVCSLFLSLPSRKTDIQDPVIKILKFSSQKYFWLTQVTCPNKLASIILSLDFPLLTGICPWAMSVLFLSRGKPLSPWKIFPPPSLPSLSFPFSSSSISYLCLLFPVLCSSWANKSLLRDELVLRVFCANTSSYRGYRENKIHQIN